MDSRRPPDAAKCEPVRLVKVWIGGEKKKKRGGGCSVDGPPAREVEAITGVERCLFAGDEGGGGRDLLDGAA